MKRRKLLQSVALAPFAGASPAAAAEAAKIAVTELEIFHLKVNHRGNWVLPRLRTNVGLTGIGEASHGKDEQVIPLLRRLFERLRGRGIFEIEWLRKEADPD